MELEERIIEISKKHHLSHLSTNLTSVGIIDEIYSKMQKDDIFVLSAGHAGLALYVVLEKFFGFDAEELLQKHGIHPKRDLDKRIFCSTGSLGLGLPVAVGYAISDPVRKVYCLLTDGECFEGSVWESLQIIKEFCVKNIEIYVNINGRAAYKNVDSQDLENRLLSFCEEIKIRNTNSDFEFSRGLLSHYIVLGE